MAKCKAITGSAVKGLIAYCPPACLTEYHPQQQEDSHISHFLLKTQHTIYRTTVTDSKLQGTSNSQVQCSTKAIVRFLQVGTGSAIAYCNPSVNPLKCNGVRKYFEVFSAIHV